MGQAQSSHYGKTFVLKVNCQISPGSFGDGYCCTAQTAPWTV